MYVLKTNTYSQCIDKVKDVMKIAKELEELKIDFTVTVDDKKVRPPHYGLDIKSQFNHWRQE